MTALLAKLPLFLGVMLLAGCASTAQKVAERRQEMAANLCKGVKGSNPWVAVAYVNAANTTIHGDVTAIGFQSQLWSSVLATTQRPVATIRTESSCLAPFWVNPWQYYMRVVPCEGSEERSLADIYGIGRANNFADAEKLALANCKSLADAFAETEGISKSNSALRCVVLRREACAVR
jgi:hypothetical protein